MFLEVNPGHPHENISNFKEYILRLSRAYQGPRTIRRSLRKAYQRGPFKLKTLRKTMKKIN